MIFLGTLRVFRDGTPRAEGAGPRLVATPIKLELSSLSGKSDKRSQASNRSARRLMGPRHRLATSQFEGIARKSCSPAFRQVKEASVLFDKGQA